MLNPYVDKLLRINSVGFDVTDHIFLIRQILEKNRRTMRQYISYS
jgi:hypothetical protein